MMSPYATLSRPAQPYSSGRLAPNSPSSAMPGISCLGNRPSMYASPMTGIRCSSTQARTVSRTARSSSLRRLSTFRKSTPVNWDVAAAVAMGILVQGLVIDLERYPG